MTWLVTGGAGYIGAHVVRSLLAAGHGVAVLDDLSTGRASVVPDGVPLIVADVRDSAAVSAAIAQHDVQGVVHLAAKKAVGESVQRPLHYYRQNVDGMLSLLEAMRAGGVGRMVYSSSASVYGTPDRNPVDEGAPLRPASPYGETKVIGEWLVRDAATAWGLSYTSLRYFNVVGAGSAELGDVSVFNLVPMTLRAITSGARPEIFGDDYPTPDGTCVRDYIHVVDVAQAHVAAVEHCTTGQRASVYNVGRGEGSSVREVLGVVAEVTGVPIEPVVVPRRPGDAAEVVASAARIEAELGVVSRRGLVEMVTSAWDAWPDR